MRLTNKDIDKQILNLILLYFIFGNSSNVLGTFSLTQTSVYLAYCFLQLIWFYILQRVLSNISFCLSVRFSIHSSYVIFNNQDIV